MKVSEGEEEVAGGVCAGKVESKGRKGITYDSTLGPLAVVRRTGVHPGITGCTPSIYVSMGQGCFGRKKAPKLSFTCVVSICPGGGTNSGDDVVA